MMRSLCIITNFASLLTLLDYIDTIIVSIIVSIIVQIHSDDWGTWLDIVQSVKNGQRPNMASTKRKRSLLAIAAIVDEMKKNSVFEVKKDV